MSTPFPPQGPGQGVPPGQGYPPQGQFGHDGPGYGQAWQGAPGYGPQGPAPGAPQQPGQAPGGPAHPQGGWSPQQGPYPPQGQQPQTSQNGGSGVPGALRKAGKSVVKRLIFIAVAAVVIGVGGFLVDNLTGAPVTAKAGDCVAIEGDKPKVVECTDAAAKWQVVARLEDKTQVEFQMSMNICSDHREAEKAYWEGERMGRGYVLCLKPYK